MVSSRTPAAAISVEFSLEQIGTVDRKECLPLLHVITDRRVETDDAALIGREDLDRHVFIEVDAAYRLLLDRKVVQGDRLDFHRLTLTVGQIDTVALGRRRLGAPVLFGACVRRCKVAVPSFPPVPRNECHRRHGDEFTREHKLCAVAGQAQIYG